MSELNFGRLLRRGELYREQPAVLDLGNGHSATYGEHLERIARMCAALDALGVESGDHLGVMAGASHVYVELWRATLSGAAVINPLNTRLSPEEIVYILEDSATEVIVADSVSATVLADVRHRLPKLRSVVLVGDDDAPHDERLDDVMASVAEQGLPSEPADDAPAVLMYTGGTTGAPKGVVLSQRAITTSIYRAQIGARFRTGERYLAFMPMFHIGGMSSWGLHLPSGGQTVVVPTFEPGVVNAAIRDHQITSVGGVPTMYAMMIDHPDFEPSMFASLERIMYGAAPMPPELLERLMRITPDLSFFQAYGMTEFAATVTALLREDHVRGGDILRSVGRPLVGVDIEVRDPVSREPLAHGDVGEIWVRCDSMFTQYWNKPEQTADSIVDGWYRSGDAGRVDSEGYVFLADRVKDMIVTGGENVYSLEVEHAISSHPRVQQVAVVAVPHPTWGEAVHAFVVCDPDEVTDAELDAYARRSIAGYKVPKSWTLRVEPLPLSAAGKVLKRRLRDEAQSVSRSR